MITAAEAAATNSVDDQTAETKANEAEAFATTAS